MAEAVIAAVEFATAADGHHEVQLCEAILKSSVSRKWVGL